jgi:U3 small nucleolar RNA-associated protein 3
VRWQSSQAPYLNPTSANTPSIEEFFRQSDEEIHPYVSDSPDEDEFDHDEDEFDEEDEDEDEDESEDDQRRPAKKLSGRKALSPTSDDEAPGKEDEDEILGWGSSKKDYYNADAIETEADALEEEEEAKKIQLKRLQAMNEEDFGFDDTEWTTRAQKDEAPASDEGKGTITEVLPQLEVSDDTSPEDRLKILKRRYPEFEPLSKDFVDLQPVYEDLAAAVKSHAAEGSRTGEPSKQAMVSTIKFRALSAYLGTISMYLAILASPAKSSENGHLAMAPSQLRDHKVMEALVTCRKRWETARALRVSSAEAEAGLTRSREKERETQQPTQPETALRKEKSVKKPKKKTKAEKAEEEARALSDKRRAERLKKTEVELAELSNLLSTERKKTTSKSRAEAQEDSDFGEEIDLTPHEAAEKAKRKKSLRFYTSQIAQKANKRSAAGRDAGGDADLPYRERLKDRQARLIAEAEKRGRREPNELERLGGDSDDDDRQVAKDVRGPSGGDDDYYEMVASHKKDKKESKKKLAEAYAEAARQGGRVEVQEEIGPDGKRAITYAIQKNKGLTPKRNKDVRNPRVKKRKKFEQKKKRLGSIRQVYKGGEGPGGYGGELTGIKRNLIKSVKL